MKSVNTEDDECKLLSTERVSYSLFKIHPELTPSDSPRAENLTLGEGREDRRLP